MPRRRRPAAKVCAEPGCPELTDGAATYCAGHERDPWRDRDERRPRTMSGWEEQRRARRVKRAHGYRCHVCKKTHDEHDLEVDHVIPVTAGGSDDESNLRPICKPCHKRKTQRESRGGGIQLAPASQGRQSERLGTCTGVGVSPLSTSTPLEGRYV